MTPTEHRYQRASSIDLLATVRPHVEMRRQGGYWRGLCPFHMEKTPSFTIREGDTSFKCYGCGQWGDVVQFVEKLRGCSRAEAVTALLRDSPIPARRMTAKARLPEKPVEYAELRWDNYCGDIANSRRLAAWRGYDDKFAMFAASFRLFGVYNGCYCFPIKDANGRIVRLHVRPRDIAAKNWFYFPAQGHPTTPLVFGDGPIARVHESQWDGLADMNNEWRKGTMDQSTWIITRGASNAHKLPPDTFKRSYIFAQNDPAGMRWAAECAKKYANAKIVVPPDNFKDVNELWKADRSLKRLVVK